MLLFHSFLPSHGFCMSVFLLFLVISAYFHFFSIYVLMSSAFLRHQCSCIYNGRELTFLIPPSFFSLVFLKELFKFILSNSLSSKLCFNNLSTRVTPCYERAWEIKFLFQAVTCEDTWVHTWFYHCRESGGTYIGR